MTGPPDRTPGRPAGRAGPRADVTESELATIRAAGVVRVVVGAGALAVGAVGAGSWDRPMTALFLLVGVVWLPWAVVLVASSGGGRRGDFRLPVYGGPIGDVAMVFAAQCLAPGGWGVFLLADALAVSLAASLWRERDAWLLVAACVGLSVITQVVVPEEKRVGAATLAMFALALCGLVVVVGRMARDHRRAAVSSHRFQQKAETILSRVGDAIVVTDGAGVVRECNPAGERLMCRERQSAVGLPCSEALGLHEGERPLDCRSGCGLLAGGASDTGPGREVWRELPDGRRQPLLATAFSLADEQGVEIVHSLRDITRLKEADEAKTLFLATASHELKTPVTVIAGFAETILRYPSMPEERRAEAVDAIRRRALELSAIVDRLLLSSKIEAGRVTVDVHPLDVRALLVERANVIQDGSGRHVILQVAPHPLVVLADPLALRTVVEHLLDNAVKYSDGGPVVLGARAEGRSIAISVSDIGIGMDEEQARHCFDKFWQAESTDVRRFGGTGIGLYIVSSMVQAMGGSIAVETAVGRGSTFTVTLPAVGGDDAAGDVPVTESVMEAAR
ncbi:MAG: PAS domain-containing sensor histidine kinase [Actinomycetota bacterium]|nr:PAS domain-containing sensor histidine kinase [Actinomycetota bacterium]